MRAGVLLTPARGQPGAGERPGQLAPCCPRRGRPCRQPHLAAQSPAPRTARFRTATRPRPRRHGPCARGEGSFSAVPQAGPTRLLCSSSWTAGHPDTASSLRRSLRSTLPRTGQPRQTAQSSPSAIIPATTTCLSFPVLK